MTFPAKRKLLFLSLLLFCLGIGYTIHYKKTKFLSALHHIELPNAEITNTSSDFNIFTGNLTLGGTKIISVRNKDSIIIHSTHFGIYGIDLWDYVFTHKIHADSLMVEDPEIQLYKLKDSVFARIPSDKKNAPDITIDQIAITNALLRIFTENRDTLASVNKMHLTTKTLHFSDGKEIGIPQDYQIALERIMYRTDHLNTVNISSVSLTPETWTTRTLEIKPRYDALEYSNHLKYQDDRIATTIDEIILNQPDISDLVNNTFRSGYITVKGLNIDVFRDKTLPPSTIRKPLLSGMLNSLPVKLEVDSVLIENAHLTYAERIQKEKEFGNIKMGNIKSTLYGINTIKKDTLEMHLIAGIGTTGTLRGICLFPLQSPTENFSMSMIMKKIDLSAFNDFTEKNLNVVNTGYVSNAYITAFGNNVNATGTSIVNYSDLHISLLNKKTGKEKKFLSNVANFLVPEQRVEQTEEMFEVERDPTRSFFNYMFQCIQKGILSSMI